MGCRAWRAASGRSGLPKSGQDSAISRLASEPAACERRRRGFASWLISMRRAADTMSPGISSCPIYLTNGSNDHREQFDRSKSNHQHRDRYRIVIEPMPFLCIHDTPPCSSNFDDIRKQVSDRIAAGRYFFVSSCWTSAVICGGTGAERASYWALR